MASIIDIKRRKASVESTGQITKAMKLVSTVKLQRAKQRADESKAYFNKMYETISSILAKAGNINHPYLQENGSTKKGIITISSNRGLAGGYNNNIVKLIRCTRRAITLPWPGKSRINCCSNTRKVLLRSPIC